MIAENEFLEAVRAVMLQHFPYEEEAFEAGAPRLVRSAMSGDKPPVLDRDDHAANHGGLGSIESLKFVLMIWGTWKMLAEWYKLGRKVTRDRRFEAEFLEEWKRRLIGAGFPVGLAHEIIESRPAQLLKLLPGAPEVGDH